MSTPTPGPWTAKDAMVWAGTVAVADCYLGGLPAAQRPQSPWSNARLISAAPDFLSLARKVKGLLDAKKRAGTAWTPDDVSLYRDACNAIAKAEGQ